MWKILFVGDVFLQNNRGNLIEGDLVKIISNHDFVSCNFEGPLAGFGAPLKKVGPNLSQFKDAAKLVVSSGFNVINLANNHILDFGAPALVKTLESFSSVVTVGAGLDFESAYRLALKEVGGVKVGFLGFAENGFGALTETQDNSGGYAWVNHPLVNKIVADAKKQVDVLLVQVHAGVEEIEIPLPEWRQRYKELIDLGADAIIGHHPHTPQGFEEYKGKPIFYSLGNFCFDAKSASGFWNQGYMASLSYEGNKLLGYEVIPTENQAEGVKLFKDRAYQNYLTELCDKIKGEDYNNFVNEKILWLWEKRYKHYYQSSLNGFSGWKGMLRSLYNFVIKRKTIDYAFLYHNLSIESHRYSAERAAKLLK